MKMIKKFSGFFIICTIVCVVIFFCLIFFSSFQPLHGVFKNIVISSFLIHVVGFILMFIFYTKKPKPLVLSHYPGVTIIKPSCGVRDNEKENYDMFFRQDYPGKIQIIFTLPSKDDPAYDLIMHYKEKYPEKDTKLIISETRIAIYRKVDAIYDAYSYIKHDYIIWSDSDTIINEQYVSNVVSALSEPNVDLVSTPMIEDRLNTFAGAFKLGCNADIAAIGSWLHFYHAQKVAFGHCIAFKKKVFDALLPKAWKWLQFYISDDLGIAVLFVKHGYKVVWRNIYTPVQYSDKSMKHLLSQKIRHCFCQKSVFGLGPFYFILIYFNSQALSVLLILFNIKDIVSWILFFSIMLFRIMTCFVQEKLFLGSSKNISKYFFGIFLWDMLHMGLILFVSVSKKINYHNRKYKIYKSKWLTPDYQSFVDLND